MNCATEEFGCFFFLFFLRSPGERERASFTQALPDYCRRSLGSMRLISRLFSSFMFRPESSLGREKHSEALQKNVAHDSRRLIVG